MKCKRHFCNGTILRSYCAANRQMPTVLEYELACSRAWLVSITSTLFSLIETLLSSRCALGIMVGMFTQGCIRIHLSQSSSPYPVLLLIP